MPRPDRIQAALEKLTRKNNASRATSAAHPAPGQFADTAIANMESVLAAR